MKDKIKEIINDLQRVADRKCYPEDILDGSIAQEWVDHITNLQEEKETRQYDINNLTYQLAKEKSKIDKAIEYFKYQSENLDFEKDTKAKMLCAMAITILESKGE